VLDGDDTLWFVEVLYDRARASVANYVTRHNLNAERWDRLQRSIDVQNVARFGLSKERFPTSCIEAFEQISAEFGFAVTQQMRRDIYRIAASVFETRAELAPHAEEVLERLHSFADLVLLTKGDETIQRKRIADSGLAHLFSEVYIVEDKSEKSFFDVLHAADVHPADAWSVGNSLASDVNPALWLGMSAIWIDAHVWEHERRETEAADGRLFRATALPEIVPIIEDDAKVLA